MKATPLLLAACLAGSFALPADARAQDDYGDLDEDTGSEKKSRRKKQRRPQVVKEIVRGTYAKSNIGGAMYLGNFSGVVNAGTSLGLSLGRDFVDREKMSMAGELMFFQGIHNGLHYDSQADIGGPFVQGDLRTYTLAGTWEVSGYLGRRFGVGVRAGGGVMFSPLLMDEQYYMDDVVMGSWGGANPTYHSSPHPVVMGGPTFEYYTKLSHFSVGGDVDVFYAVGFDLGTSMTGYLKYTF